MGEFAESLLKLTEFPFSYSLIGIIDSFFGQGLNLENLSFTKIGPLLILMGFLATTLSICDPIGAIQRSIIKGRKLRYSHDKTASDNYLSYNIFGKWIFVIFPSPYFFAVAFSPSDVMKRYKNIDWNPVKRFYFELKEISFARKSKFLRFVFQLRYYLYGGLRRDISSDFELINKYDDLYKKFSKELGKINKYDTEDIRDLLEGLKEQTVKTKWITAEVDKITALVYFIVVISVFP